MVHTMMRQWNGVPRPGPRERSARRRRRRHRRTWRSSTRDQSGYHEDRTRWRPLHTCAPSTLRTAWGNPGPRRTWPPSTPPTLMIVVAGGLAAKTSGQRPTLSLQMVGGEAVEAFALQAPTHARGSACPSADDADDGWRSPESRQRQPVHNLPRWVDNHRSQAKRGSMCDHSCFEAGAGPPCVCQGSSRSPGGNWA